MLECNREGENNNFLRCLITPKECKKAADKEQRTAKDWEETKRVILKPNLLMIKCKNGLML